MSCQVSYLNPQNQRCDWIPLLIQNDTGHSGDIKDSLSVKLKFFTVKNRGKDPCIPSSASFSLNPSRSGLCLIFTLVLQTFSAESRVAFVWGNSFVYNLLVTRSFRMIAAS